jgi:hypothetical protein
MNILGGALYLFACSIVLVILARTIGINVWWWIILVVLAIQIFWVINLQPLIF